MSNTFISAFASEFESKLADSWVRCKLRGLANDVVVGAARLGPNAFIVLGCPETPIPKGDKHESSDSGRRSRDSNQ